MVNLVIARGRDAPVPLKVRTVRDRAADHNGVSVSANATFVLYEMASNRAKFKV